MRLQIRSPEAHLSDIHRICIYLKVELREARGFKSILLQISASTNLTNICKVQQKCFLTQGRCRDGWCGRGGGGASVTSTTARGGPAQRLKCSFQQFRDRGTFCIRRDRALRRRGVFLFSEKSKSSDITRAAKPSAQFSRSRRRPLLGLVSMNS